ncbi:zinc finger protein 436-like [Manduca sexta]|uniref:Uncharacterized protein n=1 Tax=Manduca sexta TaxID=7130 RepID=A0A921Z0F6_MANSE|nr:zinc finger protein 436-like [Manduca sexta]KAG6449054.1 hypothetical protein O3G_MSEX005865 [Manduca sexta]
MFGAMALFKLLHCKHLRKISEDSSGEGTSSDRHSLDIQVKKEFDDNLCRVCLKEGLVPIHDNEGIAEALTTLCGIFVSVDDSFPKLLCQPCHSLLQGAILLRKTAQRSDEILKQPFDIIEDNSGINDDLGGMDEDMYVYDLYKDEKKPIKKKEKDYYCRKCNLEFKNHDEYTNHRLSDEHDNMRHTCHICNKSYRAEYFKKHLATHNQDPPHMCDICGKKFNAQGHFARHRLTHFYHLPYQCNLCPYKGRFSESLKMHMRSHTGEKPYQCTQCPSRFINKSNLNKHMLTHKGQHDFKCDSCGRGFYTKRELEMHFKVDHTGIKDHVCNICGKAFGYRKQMMKHQLKVHKREKLKSGRTPLYVKVELMKQKGEDIATD